jgi:hypothetical protein
VRWSARLVWATPDMNISVATESSPPGGSRGGQQGDATSLGDRVNQQVVVVDLQHASLLVIYDRGVGRRPRRLSTVRKRGVSSLEGNSPAPRARGVCRRGSRPAHPNNSRSLEVPNHGAVRRPVAIAEIRALERAVGAAPEARVRGITPPAAGQQLSYGLAGADRCTSIRIRILDHGSLTRPDEVAAAGAASPPRSVVSAGRDLRTWCGAVSGRRRRAGWCQ